MPEKLFLIEIWASVHLYIHGKKLTEKALRKELPSHTTVAFSHLQASLVTKLCRFNSVRWHPRNTISSPDCKLLCGLWILKHCFFFQAKQTFYVVTLTSFGNAKKSCFLEFTAFSMLHLVDKNILPVNSDELQQHVSAEKCVSSAPPPY